MAKLEGLWHGVEKGIKNVYSKFLVLPVVLHTTIRDYFELMHGAYQYYHNASLVQYQNQEEFERMLNATSAKLNELLNVYDKPLKYTLKGFDLLGNDYPSIFRLKALKSNIRKFKSFVLNLKDNHRVLPSFADIKKCLFGSYPEGLWNNSELDWLAEKKKFVNVDYYSDNSSFIESVDCFYSKKDV